MTSMVFRSLTADDDQTAGGRRDFGHTPLETAL